MNNDQYFKLEIKDKIIHLTAKGFWTDTILKKYEKDFLDSFMSAVDSFNNKGFVVIPNLLDFKQPSPNAKKLIGEMMAYATPRGLHQTIQVVDRSLLKSVIESLAEENISSDNPMIVFSSMEEALQEAQKFLGEIKA